MAYNLLDSCKRYHYDADIELFHKILLWLLDDDVYTDQMKMLKSTMRIAQFIFLCFWAAAALADLGAVPAVLPVADFKAKIAEYCTDEKTGKAKKGKPTKPQV